ncbi:amidohydrolase [Haladaptatus sp. AB643]|uniref:amidohydrolase n=1 Tax=Haladaptatus sp. AB643 TaxID=2934174 RepID=UPI00209C5EC2|nr:amidohydrolase [Haladaptatus sp. AB643]MCO8243476.1 amidohydrolase [Haladaptatus sp. AB643]
MARANVFEAVERERERLRAMAQRIWETPELGLHEEKSAQVLIDRLEEEGFDIEEGLGEMPTAFRASYGSGDPTIGILGEYDALPDLSQKVKAEHDPVEPGGPGHGCGHNLFGVAGVGGAIGVKRAIERGDVDGTIEFYGCPAEETLVGKVFMARDGAFDHLDAAITWHPSTLSTPTLDRSLAMDSIRFTFEGVSAHAAASPESGRSALDAVELFNTGVEYMREHVSEKARIHYVITNGGEAPNVVPAEATVWYYVRAPTRAEVERISDWMTEIADGAAMMTQTEVDRQYVTGCWDYLPNRTVSDVIWETMRELGEVGYSDEDRAFAADLKGTVPDEQVEGSLEDVPEEYADEIRDANIYDVPVPPHAEGNVGGGSTDVGDVSWITPTGQFRAATWAVGTPGHTWQATAANGDFGKKGAVYAAKVLGGTAYELLENPDIVAEATEEFHEVTGERGYETPLPSGTEPPFDITSP